MSDNSDIIGTTGAGDGKVKKLPVRFRKPGPEDRTLLHPHEVGTRQCFHDRFIIDETLATVSCGDCKASLNPMWVLKSLTARDSRFHEAHRRYNEESKRLAERSRTQCDHCGKMTRISRR